MILVEKLFCFFDLLLTYPNFIVRIEVLDLNPHFANNFCIYCLMLHSLLFPNICYETELKLILAQKILIERLISLCKVLILIPIFGVHFLLLPIRPAEGSSLEYTYEVNNHHQKSL